MEIREAQLAECLWHTIQERPSDGREGTTLDDIVFGRSSSEVHRCRYLSNLRGFATASPRTAVCDDPLSALGVVDLTTPGICSAGPPKPQTDEQIAIIATRAFDCLIATHFIQLANKHGPNMAVRDSQAARLGFFLDF